MKIVIDCCEQQLATSIIDPYRFNQFFAHKNIVIAHVQANKAQLFD
jgi:hypothetical protein